MRVGSLFAGSIIYKPRKHRISFLVAWWLTNRDLEIR